MKSVLALALALLPLALMAPTEGPAGLSRRTAGNIYMCTEEGWGGDCKNEFFALGQCKQVPDEYLFNIGSAGPDAGAICTFFDQSHGTCGGTGLAILSKPGKTDLYHENGNPGGNVKYIRCVECTNCH